MLQTLRRLAVLVATVATIAGLAFPAHCATRIIVTIDVESVKGASLPDQLDAVCRDGAACGLFEIARVLNDRGMAGTFFLNVYESRAWGDELLRRITQRLQADGHDVALHTHPQWAYDPKRNEMFQYDLNEQTEIIRDGARMLASWTGMPVVAHRAGNYSADLNTLEALRRNAIRIDSSLFWGHASSRIATAGFARNVPSNLEGLTEIPVTVYHKESRPAIMDQWLAPIATVRKIDPDWFADASEARAAMDAIVNAGLPFMVVFLHSFTFLAPGEGDAFVRNGRAMAIFAAMLDYIDERSLEVVTMRQLADVRSVDGIGVADAMPKVLATVPLHVYLARSWRVWSVYEKVGLAVVIAITLIGTVLLLARQRQRRGT